MHVIMPSCVHTRSLVEFALRAGSSLRLVRLDHLSASWSSWSAYAHMHVDGNVHGYVYGQLCGFVCGHVGSAQHDLAVPLPDRAKY